MDDSTPARRPSRDDVDVVYALPTALDMRSVRNLHADLLALLAAAGNCTLDGSMVERVSTGTLQVLAAFGKDMSQSGRFVSLANPAKPLRDAFELSGLKIEEFISITETV